MGAQLGALLQGGKGPTAPSTFGSCITLSGQTPAAAICASFNWFCSFLVVKNYPSAEEALHAHNTYFFFGAGQHNKCYHPTYQLFQFASWVCCLSSLLCLKLKGKQKRTWRHTSVAEKKRTKKARNLLTKLSVVGMFIHSNPWPVQT